MCNLLSQCPSGFHDTLCSRLRLPGSNGIQIGRHVVVASQRPDITVGLRWITNMGKKVPGSFEMSVPLRQQVHLKRQYVYAHE
jgi:hypothetical protein